jgi:hypothetical protein
MSERYPGGIITKSPATPTGPYQDGAAPGIWTLDQQLQYKQQGIWPTAGIDYITIASVGNAIDFGDLTSDNREMASCASTTRALFAGGQTGASSLTSQIQFNTIASTGNATNFGNLSYEARLVGGASSNTRAVFAGGFQVVL